MFKPTTRASSAMRALRGHTRRTYAQALPLDTQAAEMIADLLGNFPRQQAAEIMQKALHAHLYDRAHTDALASALAEYAADRASHRADVITVLERVLDAVRRHA